MENIQIFEKIKRYTDMNKLTFFVGAGVSKLSDFPSWYELVKSMGDEIGYNYRKGTDEDGNKIILLNSDEYLKIPQMYWAKFGESKYREKVENSFDNDCVPNEIHDLIMSFHPNHILTTNYDTLIEQCATKFGENYSVIASDADIAKAETTRYLLKVHGDFSREFVLKELDYLNYEFDYQLISNLMKSIFATNLVVFIGYALDDYNIKIILNWVQKVQNQQFIKPIFINTESKKNDVEKDYYFSRGLIVLDSNDFLHEKAEYKSKYHETLKQISDFLPIPKSDNYEKVLEYLYGKVSAIKNLNYIRRTDFNEMFLPDFKLNDEWKIECSNGNRVDDLWSDFLGDKSKYISIDEEKCKRIDAFVKACNINGTTNETQFYFPNVRINTMSFVNDYEGMITYCEFTYDTISENYKKAYFLSRIGRLIESYILFREILKEAKDLKCWEIYYLSQINRFHLYKMIKRIEEYCANPISILNLGSIKNVTIEIIDELNSEMSCFDLQKQFEELPYFFKKQYKFLGRFTNINCYYEEINDLMRDKYKIELSLTTENLMMGLSLFDKIKLQMLESYKFIEDNMVFVYKYEEIKNYTKNAMCIWLRAYDKEINKGPNSIFAKFCNTRLKFDLQDIIILSKCCKKEDLKYFGDNINFEKLPFEEINELKNHVIHLIDFYKRHLGNKENISEYIWWRELCLEIQMLLFFTSYYLKDDKVSLDIVSFIVNSDDSKWIFNDRMNNVIKYVSRDNALAILKILETCFLEKMGNCEKKSDPLYNEICLLGDRISIIAITYKHELENISHYVITNQDTLYEFMHIFVMLTEAMSLDAKAIILNKYEIKTMNHLVKKAKLDDELDITNYLYLIDEYIEDEKSRSEKGENVIRKKDQEQSRRDIYEFLIQNNICGDILKKHKGCWNEFDYLFNCDEFEENNFEVEWLLYYSNLVLNYIQKNEKKTTIAKDALCNLDMSHYSEDVERWFYLYGKFDK